MRYLIKSQRDGWYFKGFDFHSGCSRFGEIKEAMIYTDKYSAQKDLRNMERYGQRIIPVTRVGKIRFEIQNDV